MSEDLLKMHDAARKVKDKHDIDIMVPHGVKIGGKTFPAYDKDIHTSASIPHIGFKIPLENGHAVQIFAYDDNKSADGLRDIPAAVVSGVAFPHENGSYDFIIEENPKMHREHNFRVPEHGSTGDLVSKINEWSKKPGMGIRYKSPENRKDYSELEMVPPEELASHYQKHRENRKEFRPDRHPNIIRVSNLDKGNRFWDYNISTEEFKSTRDK